MINPTLAKHTFGEDLYQLRHRVLVLIPDVWEKISEPERQLLARILSSVKLSLDAIQVASASDFSVGDAAVYPAKTILSFGVPVAGVHQRYESTTLGNLTVVCADTLTALDDVRKKNLWGALRQVFKV